MRGDVTVPIGDVVHRHHGRKPPLAAGFQGQEATGTRPLPQRLSVARPVEQETIIWTDNLAEIIEHQLFQPILGHFVTRQDMHMVKPSLVDQIVPHTLGILGGRQVGELVKFVDADNQGVAFLQVSEPGSHQQTLGHRPIVGTYDSLIQTATIRPDRC